MNGTSHSLDLWKALTSGLLKAETVMILRYYAVMKCSLQGFSDATLKAYGTVQYLKIDTG